MFDAETHRAIVEGLTDNAEAFCRDWLADGRRSGHYWHAGDVHGAKPRKGRSGSFVVNLAGPRRGKWTDYADGTFGDLLDVIRVQRGLSTSEALQEAADWLAVPRPAEQRQRSAENGNAISSVDREERARKLFARCSPIAGTPAETYLRRRGITEFGPALAYHPSLFYTDQEAQLEPRTWPGLVCAITTNGSLIIGVNRIYLTAEGEKAPVENPKKVIGTIAPGAVRVGDITNRRLIVGEGVETILAVRTALPDYAVAATLTTRHLERFEPPDELLELWIARDAGEPGARAADALVARLAEQRPELRIGHLKPANGDFNDRLVQFGPMLLRQRILASMTRTRQSWDANDVGQKSDRTRQLQHKE